MADIFWWIIFPYITLAIMIFGTLYRYAFRQLSWTAPSTEMFEKKKLKVGSLLFHWGLVFAFIGHVMGIVIPRQVYDFIGIDGHMYHVMAIVTGSIAGLMVVIGLVVLLYRKLTVSRVRAHATFGSYFSVVMLLIVAGIGVYMTLIYNTTVVAYEYRDTIGPWFRSLFTFQPKYQLMASAPVIFQVHVVSAFLLFASIPFTNMIHFLSLPANYPARAPQQYRSRAQYRKSKV
jgi:nitrate reductase gamma subunit